MTRKFYSGYRLNCEVCGDKTALFTWPTASREANLDLLRRQMNEVMLSEHFGHKFLVSELVLGANEDQLKAHGMSREVVRDEDE